MTVSSGTQSFIIAGFIVVGSFVYFIAALVMGKATDPVIVPIIAGAIGSSLSFFLSGHIANGAAAKALDTVIETARLRTDAVQAGTRDDRRPPPAG
jgi:uncharacterized membrane protein YeaQ/YmgE (transglycosylase-associated protein family)